MKFIITYTENTDHITPKFIVAWIFRDREEAQDWINKDGDKLAWRYDIVAMGEY